MSTTGQARRTPPPAEVRGVVDDDADHRDRVVVVLHQLQAEDQLSELRWRLRGAVLAGARTVVVDATGLPELSSGMLSALLTTHRMCRVRGGGVELMGCERAVLELLDRTSLWRVFGVRVTDGGNARPVPG